MTLLLSLFACRAPVDVTWLEGFQYGWTDFNHRVGHIGFVLRDGQAEVAIVGGTSTTGVSEPLDASCDESTCQELPIADDADVRVSWARLEGADVVVGTGEITLIATAAGVAATIDVPLSGKGGDHSVALLTGLVLDTDYALAGGDACYRPKNGWLPRHIGVELGAPAITKGADTAAVPVTVSFEAGLTLEAIRACLDAVVDQAQVPITVSVAVISGDGAIAQQGVTYTSSYELGDRNDPEPQPDPDLATRPLDLGLSDPAAGWSALDFQFHASDAEGRGAYLRTLSVAGSAAEGYASGHATNYSPFTQQSGFEYRFDGTMSGIEAGGAITRGTVTGNVPAELDDSGAVVVHSFPL